MKTITLCISLALAPAAHAADNSRCIEDYNAKVARIGRDAELASRGKPPPKDIESQRQVMIPICRALNFACIPSTLTR
jgi:hypothetical protein